MRKLILADTFRFSAMVEAAGVRDIIADGLKRGAAEAAAKRETLLRLKRALDEAKAPVERDDIMRQLLAAQRDDNGLYRVGIDTAMQVVTCAARRGVEDCIYDFLAPILEVDAKTLAAMPLEEFGTQLREMVKSNDFSGFFGLPGMIQAKAKG